MAVFQVVKLEQGDVVSNFDCGDKDLNEFILHDAALYKQALLAVTYVMSIKENPNAVVAFCSLANDRVSLGDFENKTEFNRFRKRQGFPQAKRMKSYPAVKVCRLGVDVAMRGQSAGSFFLDFIKAYFLADNKTGCRFITVDAYKDAIPFYEKNGFRLLNTDDEERDYTRLMYYDLNELA